MKFDPYEVFDSVINAYNKAVFLQNVTEAQLFLKNVRRKRTPNN